MHEQKHAKLIEGLSSSPLVRTLSRGKWMLFRLFSRVWPRGIVHIHEPQITKTFWNAILPGMTVVDIGAHQGLFTVLAAARTGPAGRVFAFEPEPGNHARLTRTTRRFKNVEIVQQAVSDQEGSAQLNLDGYHGSHSLVRDGSGGGQATVTTTTLDRFLHDAGVPGVDFIKIDIEGAELMALAGMGRTLNASPKPIVLCEVHPPHKPESVAGLLGGYGYQSQLLDAEFNGQVHAAPVHLLAKPRNREK